MRRDGRERTSRSPASGGLGDYVKVRTVGRGSFGEALLVKHRQSGQLSVLKRVRLEVIGGGDAEAAAESAAREAQVLQKLRHPHIVEFLAAFVDSSRDASGGTLCLLMAFCEGGDLQHRLQKLRQEHRRLQEPPALRWFDQLCSALAYVHQRKVLHRDLKPSNIFLMGRGAEESVAVGDFGVSRPLAHAMELVTTMVGTPCYLSPEVCKGRPYSYKSDIWSLGCILYEMMALRPPFGMAPNLEALVTRIIRADVSLPEQMSSEYPEASRCARAMLRQQPDRRPTALSLLNRPRLQAPSYDLPGMQPETYETAKAVKQFSPRAKAKSEEWSGHKTYKTDGRYVVHKGVEPRQGYPSPVIVAARPRQRSELRVGSTETRAPPLSARPKVHQPGPQRSPRSPREDATAGRSSSLSPHSPNEDVKFKHRREERSRQSKAFCEWLREQRAKGKESPGSMADSSQSPVQEESSCDLTCEAVAQEECEKLTELEVTSGGQMCRSKPKHEWRTQIYCPGFPVITVEAEAGEKQVDPSRFVETEKLPCEVEPPGPADVGGTTDTEPVPLIEKPKAVGSRQVLRAESEQEKTQGKLSMDQVSKVIEVSDAAGQDKKNVSIGDRIEGIRACLEARMGTHRFQKLYKSLTKDETATAVGSLSGWPRDSSMFLPEEIDEAFVGAADGGSDDVNSLVPLVAKLVACEQSYFS